MVVPQKLVESGAIPGRQDWLESLSQDTTVHTVQVRQMRMT